MGSAQDRPSPHVLVDKPSTSFSTISSAASATSVGTARSGGSRLLFGEIDTTSDRLTIPASDSYASVCNLVLSDSSTFLRFWLTDECRDNLISCIAPKDLASLRLVCHDFSVRAAPALFADLRITFRPNSFTKPSGLAALQRLGFHVKTIDFSLPHSPDTFLPPLVDPETGDELSFTYTPNVQPPALRQPKYGDWETTEILTRQYPPLFHAATNVSAFVSAFSAFVNLSHLKISCPGHDATSGYRRSTVDFALISLRIAIERNCLNALDTLTLAPIHTGGLLYLSPLLGYGATPSSARRWSHIRHLTIHADHLSNPCSKQQSRESDQIKHLQTYLCNFKSHLESFIFRWNGDKGPIPLTPTPSDTPVRLEDHPAHASAALSDSCQRPSSRRRRQQTNLFFPNLRHLEMENATASAGDLGAIVAMHRRTLEDLDFKHIDLTEGTWDDAFAPLTRMAAKSRPKDEMAEIPIMLSPSTGTLFPRPMQKLELARHHGNSTSRKSIRASRWLPSKKQVRNAFRGTFQWM